MKLAEIISSSISENSTRDSMKRYKQPKLPGILAHTRHLKFHGGQTIHLFWLIDGKLMKIKGTQKKMKSIFLFMDILEVAAIE